MDIKQHPRLVCGSEGSGAVLVYNGVQRYLVVTMPAFATDLVVAPENCFANPLLFEPHFVPLYLQYTTTHSRLLEPGGPGDTGW